LICKRNSLIPEKDKLLHKVKEGKTFPKILKQYDADSLNLDKRPTSKIAEADIYQKSFGSGEQLEPNEKD
jgi:hypothetical protein